MAIKQKYIYRKLTRQDLHVGEGGITITLPNGQTIEAEKVNFPRLVIQTQYPTVSDFRYFGEVINWYNPAEDNYRLLVLGGTQDNPQIYEITGTSTGGGTGGATGSDIVVGYYNPPTGYFGRMLMWKNTVDGQNNLRLFNTGYDSQTTPALYGMNYNPNAQFLNVAKYQLINPPNIPNLLWWKSIKLNTQLQYSGNLIWDEQTNLLYVFPRLPNTNPQHMTYIRLNADDGSIQGTPLRVYTALIYFMPNAIVKSGNFIWVLNEEGQIALINRATGLPEFVKHLPLVDTSQSPIRYLDLIVTDTFFVVLQLSNSSTLPKAVIYIFDVNTFDLIKSFTITTHYYGGHLHYDTIGNKIYFALRNYSCTEVVLGEIDCSTWTLTPKLTILQPNNNYQYLRLANQIYKRDSSIFFVGHERDTSTNTNYIHIVQLDEQFNILVHAQASETDNLWTLASFDSIHSFEGELVINATVEYNGWRYPCVFLINTAMPQGVFPDDSGILAGGFTTLSDLQTTTPDAFSFQVDVDTATITDGAIIGDSYPTIVDVTDITNPTGLHYWEQYQA